MKNFAILHDDAEIGQILIQKSYNNQKETDEIRIRIGGDSLTAEITIEFKDEETMNSSFDDLESKELAKDFIQMIGLKLS